MRTAPVFRKTSEIKRRYKIVDGGGDMGSAIERFKQEGRMEVFAKLLEKNLISYSEDCGHGRYDGRGF